MAVAVAAAIAANDSPPHGNDFLNEILRYVPESMTKKGIQLAML